MKLKFIGRGTMFSPISIGNSNIMITSDTGKILIIDMGLTFPYIFRDEWNMDFGNIDAVFCSHAHADHSSLEMFAFHRYFLPKKDETGNNIKPKLFMIKSLMKELWDSTLKGGLESLQGKIMTLTDYFDCRPINENKSFVWEKINFTPVQTLHIRSGYIIKHSYGLMITLPNGKKIYQTSDTQFDMGLMEYYKQADVILHDCETGNFKSIVHAHLDDLMTLPENIKKKMWMYHYNIKPENDEQLGFAGFIEKGQEFEF